MPGRVLSTERWREKQEYGMGWGSRVGASEGKDLACLLHFSCSQQLLLKLPKANVNCWSSPWFPRAGRTTTLEGPRRPDR